MQRIQFLPMLILLGLILNGCATDANAQTENIRTRNNATPTSTTETPIPLETTTDESMPHVPSPSCPVTQPQEPSFRPPVPYSPDGPFTGWFWYGSNSLWTALPEDGTWYGLPHNPEGYTQKVFWWREGYIWNEESEPALTVTGKRLDAPAPPLNVSKATNAYASDIGSAMLVGVDFPTVGCWEITGQYKKSELSFVVWVGP